MHRLPEPAGGSPYRPLLVDRLFAAHGSRLFSFEGVSGLQQFLTPKVQSALTQPLACDPPTVSGQTLRAYCPSLLTLNGANLTGPIRLDSLFQPLFDLGIDDVIAFVHVPEAAQNPATPEAAHWPQVLAEGRGLRYGHRSGHLHYLPPALQIEYPARHQSQAGSIVAIICGIIFFPAILAAWLARRATAALQIDPASPIGEQDLWVNLLIVAKQVNV